MGCVDCGEVLVQGDNTSITVSGSGTPENPFIIEAVLVDLVGRLQVADTESVNMQLVGTGTGEDPLIISATATMSVLDLVDVQDGGGPSNGESLVWTTDHWEFAALPPSPAGAVNAGEGISGVGSVGDPLKLEWSGVWGTGALAGLGGDSTIGLPIYKDSAGKLRARPALTTVAWADVTGKPTEFTPAAHTQSYTTITDLATLASVKKVDGRTITIQDNSVTLPVAPAALDVVLFPEGT